MKKTALLLAAAMPVLAVWSMPAVAQDTEPQAQAYVDNGDIIVIGGLMKTDKQEIVSKVPLLGDIPGLGYLFKKTTSENKKRELLIFVTPRIVTDAL